MCGFIVSNFGTKKQIQNAGKFIDHRGPDSSGYAFFNGFHILHKRLSIIDLSKNANQPMFSNNGALCIAYNGEIYNYLKLKEELIANNFKFNTESDTEVLLALYEKYGVNFIHKLRGMFSFVLFDKNKNSLFIARDHVGMKPLFYFIAENNVLFSSEINPIIEIINIKKLNHNNKAISEYLKYGFINKTNTIYEEIKNFEHGYYGVFNLSTNILKKEKWFVNKIITKNKIKDEKEEIRKKIIDSVKRHAISDRKFGILLSGGLDSSIIAYEIKNLGLDIRAFTIKSKYHDDDYKSAKKLSNELKIPLTEINFNHKNINLFGLIDNILHNISQPYSNPTPIYLDYITKEAAKLDYRVLLTGDGADEIFFGYPRHKAILFYQYLNKIPIISNLLIKLPEYSFLFELIRNNENRSRLKLFIKTLSLDFEDAYNNWVSITNSDYVINEFINENYGIPDLPVENLNFLHKTINDKLKFAQYHDLNHFLPNNILLGGDRLSMKNSVELRFPFLDIDVIGLRDLFKMSKNLTLNEGKKLLKKVYCDKLPDYIIRRKKKGFNPPTLEWIKFSGDSINNFLQEDKHDNYLKPILLYCKFLLKESLMGNVNSSNQLWTTLVFLRWNQKINN